MNWFGESWGAPICDPVDNVPTPSGTCLYCEESIGPDDSGVMMPVLGLDALDLVPEHVECFLRCLYGGFNHQLGRCLCCGGTEPADPPGLTKREAAKLAANL